MKLIKNGRRPVTLETGTTILPRTLLLASSLAGLIALSVQSQPADKVQEARIVPENDCQTESNKLSRIVEKWRSSPDAKGLDAALELGEKIRQISLALPDCRNLYLQTIQFVLDAPLSQDSDQMMARLNAKRTAIRMVTSDDLNRVPPSDREPYRAEVLRKSALFAKQLQVRGDPSRAYLNVTPPAAPGQLTFSGQDPNTINDPVKRREYLAALETNTANATESKRRAQLTRMLEDHTSQIEKYVLRNYPATADARDEVQKILELGGFEKPRIQRLLNKLGAKENQK